MKQVHRFTGLIEREGDGYVSPCPELDLASQGETIEEARQPHPVVLLNMPRETTVRRLRRVTRGRNSPYQAMRR